MAELPGGEALVEIALVEIAQYKPASATTVSSISITLFIGGVSFAHTSTRGEVYAQSMVCEHHDLWIIVVLRIGALANGWSWGRGEMVWPIVGLGDRSFCRS
jgi:hypothetical protein